MNILLVHNYYGSGAPSGENQVFDTEAELLRGRGHTVREFTRRSDEILRQGRYGAMRGGLSAPWNPFAALALRRAVEAYRPDVVHVHNTFPLLSPSIFPAIGLRAGRVLTLHNYRLFCPAAIPMRAGQVCTDCLDRHSVWPALRHGCYRGSRLATLPLAASVALHRRLGTWTGQVEAFITLSDFQRERLVAAGLPGERVHVKPNFYPGRPEPTPWAEREATVVFVGRLTAEKGVINLLRAWRAWGAAAPVLELVGEGALRGELEALAAGGPAGRIRFLGQVSAAEAVRRIARARLLVLPSECYEGFPMVIREAFAHGTPCAVSELGPLPSIVEAGVSGLVFAPGDAADLHRRVAEAWAAPGLLARWGEGARQAFESRYTEAANHERLMAIYAAALAQREGR